MKLAGTMTGERRGARGALAQWALVLAALLLAPFAEASLPRPAATDGAALRVASLVEPSRLAALAASDDVERFALFAGDELAPELAPLASRERENPFSLHLGADVFDVESLRGPPPLSEDLCQGDDECLAGTRIGGLELEGPIFTAGRPRLSLELQWACGVSSGGLADGMPLDPWGLAVWTSEQIADRYFDESKKYGRTAAIRNEAIRRALNAEQDAQSAAGTPWWKRAGASVSSLFGKAKAADQRVENAVGEAARDLARNVVPPSTAPVDRTHRIPSEYGGGPTQSDRIANAANGLSETAGDVAEGGARGGYQVGRDWFVVSGLGAALAEARAARAAVKELPTLEIDYRRYPDLAENIWHAQKAGRPGVLTHGGIPRVNRAAATKPVPNLSPLSRDEYPFASSIEGGEGAWVGHIPVEQQNAQGALIKNFVTAKGLRPGDQYRVLVTNHPFGE